MIDTNALFSKSVGIVGCGAIGSFLAELFLEKFRRIYLYDINPEAVSRLYSKLNSKEVISCETLEDCASSSDILILAIPMSSFDEVTKKLKNLRGGSIVIETSSLKLRILTLLSSSLPRTVEILGIHPMFSPPVDPKHKKMLLIPERISEDNLKRFEKLFQNFGFSTRILMKEEHDKAMAFIQSLIHVPAMAIVLTLYNLLENPQEFLKMRNYMGNFHSLFYDLLSRVTTRDQKMYVSIQLFNPYALKVLKNLKENLDEVITLLENSDEKKLCELLERGSTIIKDAEEAIDRTNKLLDLYDKLEKK